jgi:hypothetical protein
MNIKIKDWSIIIAALVMSSAMLLHDPNRPQPLVALGYITLAIMVIGHYFKFKNDEIEASKKDNKEQSNEKQPQILNEKK